MKDDARLRILACWPYSRRGWVAPLEGLVARGHDVTYLAYRTPAEEPADVAIPAGRPRAYWREFRSGQAVIRSLRPDRVVLMATEGAWSMGVVAAARAAGVPTAVLQHGVFRWTPSEYADIGPQVRALGASVPRSRMPALSFLVRSLAGRPSQAARAVRFLLAAADSTIWEAAPRHPLAARTADAYLVASESAGRYFMEMAHVGPGRIVPVGLAEFDALVQRTVPRPPAASALLIDTPHTGGPHATARMDGREKAAALNRLGADLRAEGWTLTVKLHPDSYEDAWAVDGPEVRYARDEDAGDLLDGATVVLGFDSTLLAPALLHRPGLLLSAGERAWFANLAAELGAVPAVVPLADVTAADVIAAAAAAESTRVGRARFVTELIGPPDGRSLDRIEAALRDLRVVREGRPGRPL